MSKNGPSLISPDMGARDESNLHIICIMTSSLTNQSERLGWLPCRRLLTVREFRRRSCRPHNKKDITKICFSPELNINTSMQSTCKCSTNYNIVSKMCSFCAMVRVACFNAFVMRKCNSDQSISMWLTRRIRLDIIHQVLMR